MARRPAEPPNRQLTRAEQESAVKRLNARIKDIEELDISSIQTASILEVQNRIKSTLAAIYGERSPAYSRLAAAAKLDDTQYVLRLDGRRTLPENIRSGVERGKQQAIALLRAEADSIRESLKYSPDASIAHTSGDAVAPATNKQVFIVHGRDDAAKTQVSQVIERAGLVPVVLHEQANEGKTIIEKFEKHGAVSGFAVIVLAPDDVGGLDRRPSSLAPERTSLAKCSGSPVG
jgi:hypothetical protein